MTLASPSRTAAPSTTVAKSLPAETAWRGRTSLACAILALLVLAGGAAALDWSGGPALALGQMAGVIAPLILIGLLAWAIGAAGPRKG
jgi:hypothetical protein